jgi:hypothetical protein
LTLGSSINRSHKSHKFIRDDPIEIAIVHSLIVLIFLDIECLEVVPIVFDSLLETLQAVKDRAFIVAFSLRGISEWLEHALILLELIESFLSTHLQDDYHKGSHQEGSIG